MSDTLTNEDLARETADKALDLQWPFADKDQEYALQASAAVMRQALEFTNEQCRTYLMERYGEQVWPVIHAIDAALATDAGKSLLDRLAKAEGDCAKWQPIETAPKGGYILVYLAKSFYVAYWNEEQYNANPRPHWAPVQGHPFGVRWVRDNQPTHWQPLPQPPTALEGQ